MSVWLEFGGETMAGLYNRKNNGTQKLCFNRTKVLMGIRSIGLLGILTGL